MNNNCNSGRCEPPRRQNQRDLVIEWNRLNPEGTKVSVRKDDDSILETTTRSAAWLLGEHSAVILVEGIIGCYSLERVTVRE